MKYKIISLIFLLIQFNTFSKDFKENYQIKSGKISYHMKYLMKDFDGTSELVKGKGSCTKSCQFLVASPIKSFTSTDSNRDINMLKYAKADQHPLVSVEVEFPNKWEEKKSLTLIVNFAGVKKEIKNVPVTFKKIDEKNFSVSGKFSTSFSNHKLERPSLMMVSVDDELPISFDLSIGAR